MKEIKRYTKEHIDYVKSIATGRYNDEITKMFNEKFNQNKSVSTINALKKNHKIRSGKLPKRRIDSLRLFTVEQEEFIKSNTKGLYNDELADLVNEEFNLNITKQQIKSWKKSHGADSGLTGHFEEGREPWNKGMKGLNLGGEEGWFEKGQQPHNYRPVESERICSKDGYVIVKVQDEGTHQERWKHKHVVVWEKECGQIPEGHVVVFLDGNKTNLKLDNLTLITRGELAQLNRRSLLSSDPDITLTSIALVRFNMKINKKELTGNNEDKFMKYLNKAIKNGISQEVFKARIKRGWGIIESATKPLNYRSKYNKSAK